MRAEDGAKPVQPPPNPSRDKRGVAIGEGEVNTSPSCELGAGSWDRETDELACQRSQTCSRTRLQGRRAHRGPGGRAGQLHVLTDLTLFECTQELTAP